MKKIRIFLSVIACKLTRWLIRLLGRGGTDLPGRIALKICPDLLGELAKTVTVVIVTGTNGKTTTSRMIEQSFIDAGISYFANKTGANLISGITAEFAVHSSASGKADASTQVPVLPSAGSAGRSYTLPQHPWRGS